MFLKEGNVLKLGHSGDCTLLSACRHVSHTLRVGVLGQTCLPTSWAHCMTQPLCHLPVLPQVLCGSRQAPCPLSAPPPPLPPSTSVHPSISPSAHVVGRLKAPCRPPSHSPAASAHDQPRAGPTFFLLVKALQPSRGSTHLGRGRRGPRPWLQSLAARAYTSPVQGWAQRDGAVGTSQPTEEDPGPPKALGPPHVTSCPQLSHHRTAERQKQTYFG